MGEHYLVDLAPSFATTVVPPRVDVLPDQRLRYRIAFRVSNAGAFIREDYLAAFTKWETVTKSNSSLTFRKAIDHIDFLVEVELSEITRAPEVAYRVAASMETVSPVQQT